VRAHRPVASAGGLARGVGHGAVEAVAIEVRAGRFGWPAIKKAGGKKRKTARESSYFHFAGCGHTRRARAGLLANSGCFVSKCVLWCFKVFCGVLRVFCGVFAGVLRCFASVLRYFHKTHKTPEKHRKTLKTPQKIQYARVLSIAAVFKEQKKSTVLHKTPFTKHLQNTAKHRKTPQNSHKTRFVKLRRKTPQNKRKTLKKSQNRR